MHIPTTQLAGILFPRLGFLTNEMLLRFVIHPANLRHSARTNQLAARHFTGCFDAVLFRLFSFVSMNFPLVSLILHLAPLLVSLNSSLDSFCSRLVCEDNVWLDYIYMFMLCICIYMYMCIYVGVK